MCISLMTRDAGRLIGNWYVFFGRVFYFEVAGGWMAQRELIVSPSRLMGGKKIIIFLEDPDCLAEEYSSLPARFRDTRGSLT